MPEELRSAEEVLSRLGARLEEWQVRALFLGAQASTRIDIEPRHFLGAIVGPDGKLGDDAEDVKANYQSLMRLWNAQTLEHRLGQVQLSRTEMGTPPSVEELRCLAARRAEEITWFITGLSASGGEPAHFGEDGQTFFEELAEGDAYLSSCLERLESMHDSSPEDRAEVLGELRELTATVEVLIDRLMSLSDDARRETLAKEGGGSSPESKPVPVRREVKIGRNDPCPCGSGEKWKRCCGAAASA